MPYVSRRAWWTVAAIIASGVVAAAVEHAERKTNAAIEAVDALMDCALHADEGETCEREGQQVNLRWIRL